MPQIDCYLCEGDVLEIAKVLFAEGASITPDLDYSTREPLVVSTSENLRELLHGADLSLLFVVSPRWQRGPLQIKSVMKGRREVFYVSQREGGPTLDIFYRRPRLVDGTVAIPAGFVSYHSRFWNPIARKMESAPRALIDTYHAIRSRLTPDGGIIARKHRKLVVTRNTLSSGLKLIDLKRHVRDKARIIDPSEISYAREK